MISDTDITKLKKVFATKEDLADVKVELGEVHDKVDTVLIKLDGIVGAIHDLRQENSAGAVHLARHDRQIEALAKGTKISIPR